ncbi:hypothetical protein DM01DRAFT_326822, partial [Hesseltinella vesiculosa]
MDTTNVAEISGNVDSAHADSSQESNATNVKNELEQLGVGLVDQSSLEQKIIAEASKAMDERDDALDLKRLDKARKQKSDAEDKLKKLKSKLKDTVSLTEKKRLSTKVNEQATLLGSARRDEADILQRIKDRQKAEELDAEHDMNKRQSNETQREFLIRTGKITPFASVPDSVNDEPVAVPVTLPGSAGMSHQFLKRPSAVTDTATTSAGRARANDNDDDLFHRWQQSKLTKQKPPRKADSNDEYEDDEVSQDEQDLSEGDDAMDLDNDDEPDIPKTAKELEELFADDGDTAVYM